MTHAEDLADLVTQLVDEVVTVALVTRYREVKRGKGRSQTVVEFPEHHTRDVGLIHQLHAIKSNVRTVPVKIYRWEPKKGDTCKQECGHGRWIHVRTEQRKVRGVISTGHAVPGGSPGWDADGALSALGGSSFESRTPATTATDLLIDIQCGTDRLRRDLREAAGKRWGGRKATSAALRELVGLLPEVDEDAAAHAVRTVRGWVGTARVLLGYDAPIVALRDMYCHECRGELHVRADASTPVWCAGRPAQRVQGPPVGYLVEGPAVEGEDWPLVRGDWPVVYPAYDGCGERYPQGSWLRLLAEQQRRGGAA